MRKIIVFNRLSMDGFFSGPHGESHEWMVQDHSLENESHQMMQPDTVLMGRVTYQLFESHWPKVAEDPQAPEEARKIGGELNEMKKIVFSKTLKDVTWKNTRLVKRDLAEEVRKLKQGDGRDIVIFGSGTIVRQLTDEGLIDEYLLAITPTILGNGRSCFKDVEKLDLKLLKTMNFDSGNVLLHYKAVQRENDTSKNEPKQKVAALSFQE